MANGTPYKHAQLQETWDAIVVGSGMGGLTAAVLLGIHADKRVLVLERHYEAGGYTHAFRRPGYEWDVGLHYVGEVQDESSTVRRAFDHLTCGKVRWQPMPEVYDRFLIEGRTFDFRAGLEPLRQDLTGWFPRDVAAIDRYFFAIQACNQASSLYYAEKGLPPSVAAAVGDRKRRPYLAWAARTTKEVLEELTSNPELLGVLAGQWGDYGLPPAKSSFAIHAAVTQHYLDGGSYPTGGSGSIASAIIPRIVSRGGAVVTSAEVSEIVLEGARAVGVRMKDGRQFRSDTVVSGTGVTNTFGRLLAPDLPVLDALRSQLRPLQPSAAHLSLYLGLSESDANLGLQGTNLWIYPSFDHDANVSRFEGDLEAPFPVVYLSFPSAKDPSFGTRHPGRSTIEAVTHLPYAFFAEWENSPWKRRGETYESLKQKFADRLLAEVERQVPSVRGKIAHAELSTPATTRHFMNYAHGEIYGIASTPSRFLMRDLGARTPIDGLYLTGQDVASLGIVGAMYGGFIAASLITGKNLFSVLSRPPS